MNIIISPACDYLHASINYLLTSTQKVYNSQQITKMSNIKKSILSFVSIQIVLLLWTSYFPLASCDTVVYIVPTLNTTCPKGENCTTLKQFAATNPKFNTTLKFYPGEHHMDSSVLKVESIESFTMNAVKNVRIICNLNWTRYSFVFNYLDSVQIRGITFNSCRLSLNHNIGKVVILKSSFVNKTGYVCCTRGGVLSIGGNTVGPVSSVLIKQCTFSDNVGGTGALFDGSESLTVDQCTFTNNYGSYYHGGAIYKSGGTVRIFNSNFSHNKVIDYGGAIYLLVSEEAKITNCHFKDNVALQHGGAVYGYASPLIITRSYFSDNTAISNGSNGGALYAYGSNGGVVITDSYFSDNVAGPVSGNGGAVYIIGSNDFTLASDLKPSTSTNHYGSIFISGSTFVNNLAVGGAGGAIRTGVRYRSISFKNNTFSHNTAAYCGAVEVSETIQYNASFSKNTFTHNSAVGQVAGKNYGGALCISNAVLTSVLDNTFSHNMAAGNAGAMQVDNTDVTIKRSTFSNNAAGGDGGALFTQSQPTNYTVTDSTFTYNKAGDDGGVLYVATDKSQVKVRNGKFAFNQAINRGGAFAINGTTLSIRGASLCSKNTAKLGGVVSACKSKINISDPNIIRTPDPTYSVCFLYDCIDKN